MDRTTEARNVCIRGMACHAQGDLAGALAAFEQAVQVDPQCAEAYNNRGVTHQACGQAAAALRDFNRALDLKPNYAEAYHNRAVVRQATGDSVGALADLDEAVRSRPRYAEALVSRGQLRQALGDQAGAIADLDRALGIRPDHAEAYLGRAAVLQAQDDMEGAWADYSAALRLAPPAAAPAIYHLRACVRGGQRRFAEMVVDCDQALELEPGFWLAYVSRANARYHLRNPAALADYRAALALNREGAAEEIIRVLAQTWQQDGAEVLENCRKHIRICADDVIAYIRRGLTLILLNRDAEAQPDLEQVLQRWPEISSELEFLIAAARRRRELVPSGEPGGKAIQATVR